MGLCTENAAHQERTWRLDRIDVRPVPRQMPLVIVFPAVSAGARTPGAHEVVETCVIRLDRPTQIEAVSNTSGCPLNRSLQGVCAATRSEDYGGFRPNKFDF